MFAKYIKGIVYIIHQKILQIFYPTHETYIVEYENMKTGVA